MFLSALSDRGEIDPSVAIETRKILDMYRRIFADFDRLSGPTKADVLKNASPYEAYVRYQGFDLSNDKHAGVVRALADLGRYHEFNADLDSRSPVTITHYRSMLGEFERLQNANIGLGAMKPAEIVKVVRGGL